MRDVTLKEMILSLLPLHTTIAPPAVVDLLRERERLAEQEAEAALEGMRAVRLQYDPRVAPDRRRRLDSINARIDQRRTTIATLKASMASG